MEQPEPSVSFELIAGAVAVTGAGIGVLSPSHG